MTDGPGVAAATGRIAPRPIRTERESASRRVILNLSVRYAIVSWVDLDGLTVSQCSVNFDFVFHLERYNFGWSPIIFVFVEIEGVAPIQNDRVPFVLRFGFMGLVLVLRTNTLLIVQIEILSTWG